MSPDRLEDILKDLPRYGTPLKERGYRQVWRFELGGRPYYLKFYPRHGSRLKRAVRGNPAVREFFLLQKLQKANIPAPRAVSVLVGFRIGELLGDAVVVEGIEPSVTLDQYLNDFKLRGEPVPRRRELAWQVRALVYQLGRAKLGHSDLHLGNFLLSDNKLYLLDGYAVRTGGLKLDDVMLLGHGVNRFATRTDLLRGWREFGADLRQPTRNTASPRQWRKFLERTTGENEWFGRIRVGDWAGHYFKHAKYARRWSAASRLTARAADWEKAWPRLLGQMESGTLEAIKKSRSGDVYAAEVVLGGAPLPVVVKRPYKRYWYRYVNEIGRGSRARRAWVKAWKLIARNVPTAWPVLLLEKRTLGYVTDCVVVFERVEGPTLASVDLDAIDPPARDMLFRRTGRILRRIESFGHAHFDAKSTNWIVAGDDKLGPRPVLIDVDGVRARRWVALGVRRLLRAMLDHPQYTPADSLALCQGYAPYSAFVIEKEEEGKSEARNQNDESMTKSE